jgi:uridine kinase
MIVTGVGGGSGSGKTYLCSKVKQELPEKTLVFSMDRYYRPFKNLDDEERAEVNFDSPESLDWQLMKEHLSKLRRGEKIRMPEYSFEENTRVGYENKRPREVVLVEGIHALNDLELNEMMDLRVFLDPDPEVRAIRRMKRDIVKRNRDAEFAARQFLEMTHPAHHEHVEPTKERADLVLDAPQVDRFVDAVTEKLRRTEAAVEDLESYIAERV